MQPKMTMRDHFAAAALTGLLADGEWPSEAYDSASEEAYAHADAMLRRRGNQPEKPDSSTVTEPMPKEKRAEVSGGWRSDIRPPDAADRAAAAACDETWGIAPVAWVVMDGEEAMEFCTDEEEAKGAAAHYGVTNIVPLYRQPPCQDSSQKNLTLTDAEREAVEWCVSRPQTHWLHGIYAATLRGLLERLG